MMRRAPALDRAITVSKPGPKTRDRYGGEVKGPPAATWKAFAKLLHLGDTKEDEHFTDFGWYNLERRAYLLRPDTRIEMDSQIIDGDYTGNIRGIQPWEGRRQFISVITERQQHNQ